MPFQSGGLWSWVTNWDIEIEREREFNVIIVDGQVSCSVTERRRQTGNQSNFFIYFSCFVLWRSCCYWLITRVDGSIATNKIVARLLVLTQGKHSRIRHTVQSLKILPQRTPVENGFDCHWLEKMYNFYIFIGVVNNGLRRRRTTQPLASSHAVNKCDSSVPTLSVLPLRYPTSAFYDSFIYKFTTLLS